MPYSSDDKKKIMRKYGYTEHEAEIFIKAFNAAYSNYDGDEERAFKVAHAAVNKYQAKRKNKKVRKALPAGFWSEDHVLPKDEEQEPDEEENAFAEGFLAALSTVEEATTDHIPVDTDEDGKGKPLLEVLAEYVPNEGSYPMAIQMPDGSVWSHRTLVQTEDMQILSIRPTDRVVEEPIYVILADNDNALYTAKHLIRHKGALVVRWNRDNTIEARTE
jgi:cation transport regulator ChaB